MKDHSQDHLRNSHDDYLWDRSGDPDPEIQQLEQVMSTLRHQPRPLAIPDDVKISRSSFRRFGSRLAIAATILLAIGAGALWLNMGTKKQSQVANTNTKSANADGSLKAAVAVTEDVLKEFPKEAQTAPPAASLPDPNVAAIDPRSKPGSRQIKIRRGGAGPVNEHVAGPANPVLAANELREAEAGKERLMLALRFASTKLNVALKKAQGTSNRNIYNQHRIG